MLFWAKRFVSGSLGSLFFILLFPGRFQGDPAKWARGSSRRLHYRRFTEEFGTSPAAFVERLRIDEACHRLSIRENSVEDIAVSVGFKSAATFQRRLLVEAYELFIMLGNLT
jgi:Helix-turn-helix domain